MYFVGYSNLVLWFFLGILSSISSKYNMGLYDNQVMETARQVASFPVSSTPIPYDQVRNQCEALVTGKQQKMSVLQSFKQQQEAKAILLSSENEKKSPILQNMVGFLSFSRFYTFLEIKRREINCCTLASNYILILIPFFPLQ